MKKPGLFKYMMNFKGEEGGHNIFIVLGYFTLFIVIGAALIFLSNGQLLAGVEDPNILDIYFIPAVIPLGFIALSVFFLLSGLIRLLELIGVGAMGVYQFFIVISQILIAFADAIFVLTSAVLYACFAYVIHKGIKFSKMK